MSASQCHSLRKLALTTAIIVVLTCIIYAVSYCFFDQRIASWIYRNIESGFAFRASNFISLVFNSQYWKRPLELATLITVILLCFRIDKKKWGRCVAHIVLSFAFAAAATSALKILIGRARPMLWIKKGVYGFSPLNLHYNYWSTPSGHCVLASTTAFLIIYYIKNKLMRCLAVLLMLSTLSARVLLLKHYPSDVFFGAVVGWMVCTYTPYTICLFDLTITKLKK